MSFKCLRHFKNHANYPPILFCVLSLELHGQGLTVHNSAPVKLGLQSVNHSSVERMKAVISRTVFRAVTAKMATPLSEMPASEVRNLVLEIRREIIVIYSPLLRQLRYVQEFHEI